MGGGGGRAAAAWQAPTSLLSPQLRRLLLDCAVELPHKAPVYAALAGLLNAGEADFGKGVVADAAAHAGAAAAAGDAPALRLGTRWLAALAAAGVATTASVGACLTALLDGAAASSRAASKAGAGPREWQRYADDLAAAALAALPWCGADLAAAGALDGVLQAAEAYAALRPSSSSPGLSPFVGPLPADDPLAASDSGGASYLGELWGAVRGAAAAGEWAVAVVPAPATALAARLAAGEAHAATPPLVPADPPCLAALGAAAPAERAAALLASHPPRGRLGLLEHALDPLARLVAEDYILDALRCYEGDRIACARTLAAGLPSAAAADEAAPGGHAALLADTLLAALLRPPTPALKPVAYAAVMVDVTKLVPGFPRAMSGCVRALFSRVDALDPELADRALDWLAYHLSNFEFMWPWAKWGDVLSAPAFDGRRRFVCGLIARLVNLAYWQRVESVLPTEFRPLLPPQPDPAPLLAAGSDAPAAAAAAVLALARRKASPAALTEWAAADPVAVALGGAPAVARALVRGLLTAGAKSFTHMITALERYMDTLGPVIGGAGPAGEAAALAAVGDVWAAAPARAAAAIDRLMALRLVSGEAIIEWALTCEGARAVDGGPAASAARAALRLAADKLAARAADAAADASAARGAAVDAAEAADAAEERAAAGAAGGGGDTPPPQAGPRAAAAAAEADAERKEADLEAALGVQRDALVTAARLAVASLAAAPTGAADAAASAWRATALAALRGFVRRHHEAYAAVEGRVRAVVAVDGVPPDVRAAVEASLDL